MKTLLKVMLLAMLFLIVMGEAKCQIYSDNEEFYFNYIPNTKLVITSLGDTTNIGNQMFVGISNEGHIYTQYAADVMYYLYYSEPFISEHPYYGFIELKGDEINQLLIVTPDTVTYQLNNGEIHQQFKNKTNNKWLNLWSYE